ncbi:MAG: hypothetical protein V4669_14085 [Pseudomonadota bacterium]
MDESGFHVMLEGARVGPYDRRTIVGMRIKETLTSDHVLIASDGAQLTVADLIGRRPVERFNATRSGVFSVVRATYSAALIEADRRGLLVPPFQGEVEARVQSDVLRLAGRFRKGLGTQEGRIKIPLADVVQARVKGTVVEIWLRNEGQKKLQRIAMELFTPAVATEMVTWFPNAAAVAETAVNSSSAKGSQHGLWVATASIAVVFAVVLMVLLWPRVY